MAFAVEYFHERVLAGVESWSKPTVAALASTGRRAVRASASWPLRHRARDLLLHVGQRVVVLHAFIKKSRQTPDRDLKLARKRPRELLDG